MIILGRININVYITFHRRSSNFKNIVNNFLDFHLFITKRVQPDEGLKFTALICGVLVYDIANNSLVHNGRFHVLLGKSSEERRGSAVTYLYMKAHLHMNQMIVYLNVIIGNPTNFRIL